jgi:hypothetical protein
MAPPQVGRGTVGADSISKDLTVGRAACSILRAREFRAQCKLASRYSASVSRVEVVNDERAFGSASKPT